MFCEVQSELSNTWLFYQGQSDCKMPIVLPRPLCYNSGLFVPSLICQSPIWPVNYPIVLWSPAWPVKYPIVLPRPIYLSNTQLFYQGLSNTRLFYQAQSSIILDLLIPNLTCQTPDYFTTLPNLQYFSLLYLSLACLIPNCFTLTNLFKHPIAVVLPDLSNTRLCCQTMTCRVLHLHPSILICQILDFLHITIYFVA